MIRTYIFNRYLYSAYQAEGLLIHASPILYSWASWIGRCCGGRARSDIIWHMKPSWHHFQSTPQFNWSRNEESNPRHSPYKGDVLSLNYIGKIISNNVKSPRFLRGFFQMLCLNITIAPVEYNLPPSRF